MNNLIYRTLPDGISFQVGTNLSIGPIDITNYERIRVVARGVLSNEGIIITLSLLENNEQVCILEQFGLNTLATANKIYDALCTKLKIEISALPVPTAPLEKSTLGIFIYGWQP